MKENRDQGINLHGSETNESLHGNSCFVQYRQRAALGGIRSWELLFCQVQVRALNRLYYLSAKIVQLTDCTILALR